jgi:predicted nucleotidyltransferase
MSKTRAPAPTYVQPYRYASPNIPMSAIRRFARQIAEKFRPEKIVLFGSYAYGQPHSESDVDILVIMPAYDVVAKAIRIGEAFEREFAHSVIVRTPKQIERGLKDPDDRDWFLYEVMTKGRVLYEAPHSAVGAQSRRRHPGGKNASRGRKAQTRSDVLPLSTVSRKISKGAAARTRAARAKNS